MEHQGKPVIRTIFSGVGNVVFGVDNMRMAMALARRTNGLGSRKIHDVIMDKLRETFDVYMRGQLTTDGYRRVIKLSAQLACTDDDFDEAFADIFMPNAPVIRRWEKCRALGVRLVATSNIDELRHSWLLDRGLQDMFDCHCLSYQIGVIKPDPEFFREALRIADCDPNETLCVDDRAETVEAAKSLGIRGCTYDLRDHAAFERYLGEFAFETFPRR